MAEIDLSMLSTSEHGYTVDDEDDDDPVLLDRDGNPVDTWRERYPYDERMPRSEYEREKRLLQIELLKLQNWTKRTGARHVILFEGRDAAGKGGTIKRFMEHLSPAVRGSWRWRSPLTANKTSGISSATFHTCPPNGEMVLFDRSWYNRAGVEKVMGFCTADQHAEFIRRAPLFEGMLVSDGISLTKLWFSVSPAEQRTRFAIRQVDPVRQCKFSPTDLLGQMGRLHRGQGRDVRNNRHRFRAVDRCQKQRQEARPGQRHAPRTQQVRLRRQG